MWDCVVITCPTLSSVIATEREIEIWKKKKRIPDSVCFLTIKDPAENLGSGAATLNALLIATEYLSSKRNLMVLSSDVLLEARILILHNGRDYLYSCTGKGFISLPVEYTPLNGTESFASGIMTVLESAYLLIDKLSRNSPSGVWVCSTDMLIMHKNDVKLLKWEDLSDVVMIAVPSDIQYATGHGVVSVDDQGFVSDILYCAPFEQVSVLSSSDGKVPLVSGIVFFKAAVAESLLSLHVQYPLNNCTYLGLDSGNEPIQVSLYFDMLVAMTTNMKKDVFVSGKCGKTYNLKAGIGSECSKETTLARSLVWEELSKYRMSSWYFENSEHLYWSNFHNAEDHMSKMFRFTTSRVTIVHSSFKIPFVLPDRCLFLNSCIGCSRLCLSQNVVVSNSAFCADYLSIGQNCLISNIKFTEEFGFLKIPGNLFIMQVHRQNHRDSIIIIFGVWENPWEPVNHSSFCNQPWQYFMQRLSLKEEDLWDSDLPPEKRCLMNANLYIGEAFTSQGSLRELLSLFLNVDSQTDICRNFIERWKKEKRYSLHDILNNIDYTMMAERRRALYAVVSRINIIDVLRNNKDEYLLPYFQTCCDEGSAHIIMSGLDKILTEENDVVVRTRALSCMADLLSIKAGVTGGLRSGPGKNRSWNKAFELLLRGDTNEGIKSLLEERSNWLGTPIVTRGGDELNYLIKTARPDHLVRAARHFERAAQILIQNSVKTVKEFMVLTPSEFPDYGTYVTASCPARVDLQGGWSDTPPICYELEGSVVNIAITIDGKEPVGAKACRISQLHILLKMSTHEQYQEVMIKDVKDVLNYDQPGAEGALLKAALICTNVVDVESEETLEKQLLSKFNGGFEIQSWSILPQGCGMGTSSILAAAIVSVMWSVSGRAYDKSAVIHAVLYVEQLLTTGGGWQDQVAGVMGGVNRGYSEGPLPLRVKVEPIEIDPIILSKLNQHLMLIYTGKVRLAKNLLQNVIRNWYAREEKVFKCFKDLISNSFKMKSALERGDFPEIGRLMDTYWGQKKILAPGCEPQSIKEIMDLLRPLCYGQLLAGAGGGGYMCVLTKEPCAKKSIRAALKRAKIFEKLSFHTVSIHFGGLQVS